MRNFLSNRIKTSRRNAEWYLMKSSRRWFVYILECSDGTLYTGVTTDIERRLHEHNHTDKGAKYTRARRPVSLVACKIIADKSRAFKLEHKIKTLRKDKKIQYLTEIKE